jgi:hypothetical protein
MDIDFQDALSETADTPRILLLGNGFSIDCYQNFSYANLLDRADFSGSPELKKTFELLETCDFEQVIRALLNSSSVMNVMTSYGIDNGEKAKLMIADVEKAKTILLNTIKSIHPDKQASIDEARYKSCRSFMSNFIGNSLVARGEVFTLNYDLLLYWMLMSDRDSTRLLDYCDGFDREGWIYGGKNTQDQNVTYLHGAFHLMSRDGRLEKISYKKNKTILDQISAYLDKEIYPLIVTEGKSKNKLLAINQSEYLNHAVEKIKKIKGNLFAIGISFGEENNHVWHAISKNKNIRKLYVGVHESDQESVRRRVGVLFHMYPCKFFKIETVSIWR